MDALQKEEVENSMNLVYGEKKSLALAFFETDDKEDKEDKKRKLDEQNLLQATRFAVERMQKLPISSRLLKDVHWVMMHVAKLPSKHLVVGKDMIALGDRESVAGSYENGICLGNPFLGKSDICIHI
jgi:hypothetical protein